MCSKHNNNRVTNSYTYLLTQNKKRVFYAILIKKFLKKRMSKRNSN